METHGIDAIPFSHEKLEEWRDSLRRGVQFLHPATNLLITGGVDDLWVDRTGNLIIVDYKATSKDGPVSIDADWQIGYKRQMSLYAWLFKMNGFSVSDIGYFVYCNGNRERDRFDKRLEFEITILPYQIDDSWVDKAIHDSFACLSASTIPDFSDDCDYCQFARAVAAVQK